MENIKALKDEAKKLLEEGNVNGHIAKLIEIDRAQQQMSSVA